MRLFFASESKAKQGEVARLAAQHPGLEIVFPTPETRIDVSRSGSNSEENALLKALPYQYSPHTGEAIITAEDNGLKIPALNNEPGVQIRRWAGYVMSDQEIIDYCLERMKHLKGQDRRAVIESVVVVLMPGRQPRYYRGEVHGRILEEPIFSVPLDGFPFRTIFWVDGLQTSMYHMHNMSPRERGGFLTHREQAFERFFQDLVAGRVRAVV